MQRLLAESLLLSAEASLAAPATPSDEALNVLIGFEDRFADQPELIGQAMRLRILVYQDTGQLDRAAAIIPEYIGRDPENAGAILQGLLKTLKREIEQAEQQGLEEQAHRKAQDALLVARSLYEWAASDAAALPRAAQLALKLEYGEALLRARQPEQALQLFESVVQEDAAGHPDGRARNGRAVFGLAESYFRCGKPAQALPHFNRLYAETAENSDLWWKAFLREVQCRMGLDQDPRTLYNLIRQKRAFFPEMGGLEEEFKQLQVELVRQRDG